MDFWSTSGACKEDGDEVKRMGETYNTPIRRGLSGVDVSGEYTLEYGIDCMLNEVRWQVVKYAYVMGPCRRKLS